MVVVKDPGTFGQAKGNPLYLSICVWDSLRLTPMMRVTISWGNRAKAVEEVTSSLLAMIVPMSIMII